MIGTFLVHKALVDRYLSNPSIDTSLDYAKILWESSLFDDFLNKVLKKLIENAVPITLKSGFEISKKILQSLSVKSTIILNSLEIEKNELIEKIANLEADLLQLQTQRQKLDGISKKVNRLRDTLRSHIETYFSTATNVPVGLITIFGDQDVIETNKTGIRATLRGWFDMEQPDAETVGEKLSDIAESEMKKMASALSGHIQTQFDYASEEIFDSLEETTKIIVKELERKLSRDFDLDNFLAPPKARIRPSTISTNVSFSVKKWTEKYWTHKSEHSSISKRDVMSEYSKKVSELRLQFNNEVDRLIENVLESSVNDYFQEIDSYIEEYRDLFKIAVESNSLDADSKKNLEIEIKKNLPRILDFTNSLNEHLDIVSRLIN
jgi:hypothetical protein